MSDARTDTPKIVLAAFLIVPELLGIGAALPESVLVQLIVGQYLIKLLIALVDTPFVYAVVGYVRSAELVEPQRMPAD